VLQNMSEALLGHVDIHRHRTTPRQPIIRLANAQMLRLYKYCVLMVTPVGS
jgi:hypothetical protein